MRIIIVGAGEVGFELGRRLSEEGQDVVLIESSPDRAEYVDQQLDVMTIVGNGASLPVLQQAGIASARLILAVTSRDEVNVLSCLAASRFNVDFKIARVSNPEYYQTGSVLSREQLGIDLMINPERECALESYQLLQSGAAAEFGVALLQMADAVDGAAEHIHDGDSKVVRFRFLESAAPIEPALQIAARPSPKPWPMKWVILVIVICLGAYTFLTLRYRKQNY